MTAPDPMSFDIPGAARRLGPAFTESWLKKHVADNSIPHGRAGGGRGRAGRVYFTPEHLAAILAQYEHKPAQSMPRGPVTRRRSA